MPGYPAYKMAEEDGEVLTDQDRLLQRHKKEKKELQAKIQALKHSIPKGDKKKKKQVTAEVALLEAKLDEKHKQELNDISKCQKSGEVINETEFKKISETNSLKIHENQERKITRAQKRRDKKAALEKEREQRIKEAEIENINSARNVEHEKLKALLMPLGLKINEIPPDGHCLYKAIADQMQRLDIQHDYKSLRQLAANYMREHQNEFIPFLINQETGDCYSPEEFVKYCEDVSDTAAWGGQLEIQAISSSLQLAVKIFQAVGPVVEIGKQYNEEIFLSYHHYAYGLGKHYNSVVRGNDW